MVHQIISAELPRHDHSTIACSRHIYEWCCSSRTSRWWETTHSTQHHRRGCNNIPSFLQRTAPIARSLCEGWTPHDLHILVTAPFCCDRKSRAAYAQSFALWKQATIEFTCHDHSPRTLVVTFNDSPVNIGRASTPRSLYYCLFAPHIWMVLFFTHTPFVVNHTFNATQPERLQHRPLLKRHFYSSVAQQVTASYVSLAITTQLRKRMIVDQAGAKNAIHAEQRKWFRTPYIWYTPRDALMHPDMYCTPCWQALL